MLQNAPPTILGRKTLLKTALEKGKKSKPRKKGNILSCNDKFYSK